MISPILANIYLNKFDNWIENTLIPKYTRGRRSKANPEYNKITCEIKRNRDIGDYKAANMLKIARRNMSSINTKDGDYRRLRYVRYADDFILGFTGTKSESEEIKAELGKYLKTELKLDLSEEKTLITHASTTAAKFLGYNVKVQMANDYIDPKGRRGVNGVVGLFVPSSVIDKKCAEYMKNGKTIHRGKLLNDDDFSIIQTYQQEYRGIVQYYKLAQNVSWCSKLHWIMQGSLLKTLAYKHKSSMLKIKSKYAAETTDLGTGKKLKCLRIVIPRENKKPLIAEFGGISLSYQKHAIIDDTPYKVWGGRTELVKRLLADTCELCGNKDNIEVHHIRKLADIKSEKPIWAQVMATRKRKTLVVCRKCHNQIHNGTLNR